MPDRAVPSARITTRSVAVLGTRLARALDRGDVARVRTLTEQMIAIALSDSEASVAAYQWLAAHDDGLLNDALRTRVWQAPQILTDMIHALRRVANAPDTPRKQRSEARRLLEQYGFDDASLANEPLPT